MLREIIQNVLLVAFLICCGIGWWVGYVQPRHDVMQATHACMLKQGPLPRQSAAVEALWTACLGEAGQDKGSALLEVVGL